jgi:type IV pilus assembly protein PilW
MQINIKNNLNIVQQRGFSLIELMIAIPLGLLVMFAILKIFTANVNGVNLQNSYARVQENGRMSVGMLARDIRVADYWGCINDISAITNNLNTTDEDYDATLIPSGQQSVSGQNDVLLTTIAGISVIDDTDTLTLWSSTGFSNSKMETPYMTAISSSISISTDNGITQGDMLVISDCEKADLFTNTSANTDLTGTVEHSTSSTGAGNVDNASSDFTELYDGTAQLLKPYVKTYFIGQNSAGSSSLYRSFNGTANELVRGMTDLQLIYGEDTSGNGSADTFVDASLVTDMDNVSSIRLQLVSDNGTGSSSLERTYTVTVNIRNRTLQ